MCDFNQDTGLSYATKGPISESDKLDGLEIIFTSGEPIIKGDFQAPVGLAQSRLEQVKSLRGRTLHPSLALQLDMGDQTLATRLFGNKDTETDGGNNETR
jgi:hypothetical protein